MDDSAHGDMTANLLAAIVESSSDAIIGKTLRGVVASWNRGAQEIFGYTAEEMVGQSIRRLIPDHRQHEETRILAQIELGQRVEPFETQRLHKDGRLIDVSVTVSPIRNAAGAIIGLSKVARDISERNRAHLVAARLAAIVDWSDDAIVGKDLDGTVTNWNRGAERIFGFTADEMVGTSIRRVIPPERQIEETGILERIGRGETVAHFETQRVCKDGRRIDVSVTMSPIRDGAGRIVGVSKVVRDITERLRAEADRHTSDGRYRALFDHAPDGIVIADCDSRYLDANASMCRMLGYEHGELVGLHAADIVAPAEIAHIEPALRQIANRDDYYREWCFRRKDGTTFVAEVIATTMPDGHLLGMIRDVTERNQAVEALRAAEERMRFALEAAGVGIWDLDCAKSILRWSPIVERQYGVAPGRFAGTVDAFLACVHPDDRDATRRALERATRAGSDFTSAHRALWSDGTIRWLTGVGRFRLGPQGAPLRGVGISLDITDQRAMEAQSHQAHKMEALGRLAGGVAHDFNNLLTAILGYCELLLLDFPPGDAHQADISEIQKAGSRAAGLTRQLLAFSRKQIIEPVRLDLNEIVREMMPLLTRLIGEDVAIILQLEERVPAIVADRGQIEQVVMNLAVNARDAMPTGGTLTFATRNVELDQHYVFRHRAVSPGPYVALHVTDTGTGMTPEVQARLFEPFFTTKSVGMGTGLGMATVDGIVARSGGTVGVDSEPGRGTSFTIYLPPADPTVPAATAPPPSRPVPVRKAPKTVLVVDDAEGLRTLTTRLLERYGYQVLAAGDAAQAEAMIQTAHVDVLLTDVVMPGASGPELTARLLERQPSLRVVYMSGYAEDAIVEHGVLQSGVTFLHKPFTSESLAGKIEEALQGREGSARAGKTSSA